MEIVFDSERIKEAKAIAASYYDKATFQHALRVAEYTKKNHAIPEELMENCVCLAIMHDLLEDTDYDPSALSPDFRKSLELITKANSASYDEYCQKIHDSAGESYGLCAWFVKLADMKDHLMLTNTLTPRLKEKYLSGLRYLL